MGYEYDSHPSGTKGTSKQLGTAQKSPSLAFEGSKLSGKMHRTTASVNFESQRTPSQSNLSRHSSGITRASFGSLSQHLNLLK